MHLHNINDQTYLCEGQCREENVTLNFSETANNNLYHKIYGSH